MHGTAVRLRRHQGQITQVPGPEFYPLEWTSYGSRSNLEGGLVPGGRSAFFIPFLLDYCSLK